MISYLKQLLADADGNAIVIQFSLRQGSPDWSGAALIDVDEVGIVVVGSDRSRVRCFPWTSIIGLVVETIL